MSKSVRRVWVFTPYLYLLPSFFIIGLFFILPTGISLYLSFTNYTVINPATEFVGSENYIKLVHDPVFWKTLFNTLEYVGAASFIGIPISLGIAILLFQEIKGKGFFRSVVFLPTLLSGVSIAIIWKWIYSPQFSILNYYLVKVGFSEIPWISSPQMSMPSVIIMALWKNIGFNMMIFLAGLTSIPVQVYEAASIDGANGWQRIIHITIPLLAPITLFVTIITIISAFQLFTEPFVLTAGEPLHSSRTIVMYLYRQGFRFFKMGYASAIASILFFIILTISTIRLWTSKEW